MLPLKAKEVRHSYTILLHIREINDLGKYLEIPLLYKKQTTTVFQGLIERMKK